MTIAQLRELLCRLPQECDPFPVSFLLADEAWTIRFMIVAPPIPPGSQIGRVHLQDRLFPGNFWLPPVTVFNHDGPLG